uniref:Thyroglobulin type-1 domain-containing protein n=1 Tax=Oryzias latipes TaxID=8090 RepID=A0A3B3HW02_ORYLA
MPQITNYNRDSIDRLTLFVQDVFAHLGEAPSGDGSLKPFDHTAAERMFPPSNTRKPQPQAESSVPALALGDPRGVYTRSCAHSLRCQPSEDETRPLHALLEERGACSNVSSAEPTQHRKKKPEFPHNPQAPCRKLLTSLMRGLHAHLFQSHHDIYVPNCAKRGFFQKTGGLCWSSRGKWRGKCWCVDENGTPISETFLRCDFC